MSIEAGKATGAGIFDIGDGAIRCRRAGTGTPRTHEFLAGWREKLDAEIGEKPPKWKVGS